MRRILFLLPLLAVAIASLLFVSCSATDSDILATIGDDEISIADFLLAHTSITVFNRPPLLTQEDRERFLNTLINKEILLAEAGEMGLYEDPEVVQTGERWEKEYCARALYKDVSEKNLEISADEVKEHWITSRARIRARHIMVATAEAAQDIRAQLESGEDFARLAREQSIDEATSRLGGDLGFMDEKTGNPVLRQMARDLDVGEISKVLRSQSGFHVMEVISIQDPDMELFENERYLAGSELRANLKKIRWDAFLQEQLNTHQVSTDQDVVIWLNSQLPQQGIIDFSWHEGVSDERKAQVLVKWSAGSWTVSDFMGFFSPGGSRGTLWKSPSGGLIKRTMEGDVLNSINFAEAKSRALHEQEEVTRQVGNKIQSKVLDILHEKLITEVDIEEDQIRERYEEVKADLITPESVNFRVISLMNKDLANEVSKRLQGGEDFEAVAREINQGELKESGGLFGPIVRESISIPALQNFLFDLAADGMISDILDPPGPGLIIVKLITKVAEHATTYEEAFVSIEQQLLSDLEDQHLNDWLDQKRDELGVKVYTNVLSKMNEGQEEDPS